jgi:hypothetical protein
VEGPADPEAGGARQVARRQLHAGMPGGLGCRRLAWRASASCFASCRRLALALDGRPRRQAQIELLDHHRGQLLQGLQPGGPARRSSRAAGGEPQGLGQIRLHGSDLGRRASSGPQCRPVQGYSWAWWLCSWKGPATARRHRRRHRARRVWQYGDSMPSAGRLKRTLGSGSKSTILIVTAGLLVEASAEPSDDSANRWSPHSPPRRPCLCGSLRSYVWSAGIGDLKGPCG